MTDSNAVTPPAGDTRTWTCTLLSTDGNYHNDMVTTGVTTVSSPVPVTEYAGSSLTARLRAGEPAERGISGIAERDEGSGGEVAAGGDPADEEPGGGELAGGVVPLENRILACELRDLRCHLIFAQGGSQVRRVQERDSLGPAPASTRGG